MNRLKRAIRKWLEIEPQKPKADVTLVWPDGREGQVTGITLKFSEPLLPGAKQNVTVEKGR
jgi:hypothetical protein